MNERIRELAFEAAGGMLSYDGEDEWRLSQKEAEKFAELIVKECVNVLHDTEPRSRHISHALKQHFGVE